MRKALALLPDAATAAVHSASLGIATGVMGCVIAGTLGFGALSASIGFLSGSALFGHRLWRTCHPRRAFLAARYEGSQTAPEAHVEIR
jgi:hypothetical protein